MKRAIKIKLSITALFVGAVIVSVGVSVFINKKSQMNYVAFDMKGTVNEFVKQSAKENLSEESSKIKATKFTAVLNQSLVDYQKEHNAIVMVAPAVVIGAKDITGEIQTDIAERMKQ